MKIALFPSAFAPMIGGIEELTAKLAIELASSGDEVEIWVSVPDAAGKHQSSRIGDVVIQRLPMPMPPARVLPVLRALVTFLQTLVKLVAAYRRFRPDVLHVQGFSNNGAYATLLSIITGCPLVVTLQGETFMDDGNIYGRSAQLRAALRVGLKRAAVVTGCSRYVLDDARRFGLGPDEGVVVFNGVDLDEPTAATPPVGRYVLGIGRLVENKGFDLLLRAYATVVDEFPDVRLVIAGDGLAAESLRALCTDLGIQGHVEFRGSTPRPEVGLLMAHAEVVVVPSRVEPFGIVVLEAWRAARPVIASNRGGISEFLTDGQHGILLDPLDLSALASALTLLLEDLAAREHLGHAGRERVRGFAWTEIAKKYRGVYRRAQITNLRPSEYPRAIAKAARVRAPVIDAPIRWLRAPFVRKERGPAAIEALRDWASTQPSVRFVQLGSNDGLSGDPLHELVRERRWTGLLVEPIPALFERLQANYRDVDGLQFLQCAVGDQDGPITLYRVQGTRPGDPDYVDQLGVVRAGRH